MTYILFIVFIYGTDLDIQRIHVYDSKISCLHQAEKIRKHIQSRVYDGEPHLYIGEILCIPKW